ncbi:hypothetical protein [Flavobacterium sp.]|jgi:hypothetical protein|uniref:hypothetical protein n=1 Tax=Flavobacterium sp. TaxID=239 RepID=UPI00391B49F3
MKKIILTIVFLSFFAIACDSEDDVTYTTPDYISGKWFFDKQGTINTQNIVIYQDYVNTTNCEKDNLEFHPDGTYTSNDFEANGSNCVNDVINGDYEVINKEIKLTYTEGNIEFETVFTIVSLTYTDVTVAGTNDLGEIIFFKLKR